MLSCGCGKLTIRCCLVVQLYSTSHQDDLIPSGALYLQLGKLNILCQHKLKDEVTQPDRQAQQTVTTKTIASALYCASLRHSLGSKNVNKAFRSPATVRIQHL